MKNLIRRGLAGFTAAALIAGAAGSAKALQIVQNIDFNTGRSVDTEVNGGWRERDNLDETKTLSASQFDASLGTLDKVFISISGVLFSHARARFADDIRLFEPCRSGPGGCQPSILQTFATAEGYQWLQHMSVSFSLPHLTRNRLFADRDDFCAANSDTGTSVHCGTSLPRLEESYAFSGMRTGNALDPYIGTGDFSILVGQFGEGLTEESDNRHNRDYMYIDNRKVTLSQSGSIKITYEYTPTAFDLPGAGDGSSPIPEPATLSLFGLGLAGLGLAARRRKAH